MELMQYSIFLRSLAVLVCFCTESEAQRNYVSLKVLGCWRDHHNSIIPSLEGTSSILNGYYKTREDAVQKCARAALVRGYRVFALQDGGLCRSSNTAADIYNRFGESKLCGEEGKGGFRANQVYSILGTVRESPGRPFSRYVKPEYVFQDGSPAVNPATGQVIATRSRNRGFIPPISSSKIVRNNDVTRDDKITDDQHSVHAFILNDLGCWGLPSSGLSSMEGNLPGLDGHYRYRTNAVQKCAKAVGNLGYEIIAIHDGGKCMTASNADTVYQNNGKRRSCSYTGKGSQAAIQVYEIRYSKTRNAPPAYEGTTPSTVRVQYVPASRLPPSPRSSIPPTPTPVVTYDITNNREYIYLTDLGCWKYAWNDSIPSLERRSSILDGHYSQRLNAIQKCAEVATAYGYDIFAIQDGGRCASSYDARTKFTRLAPSSYCRKDGRGGSWVNQVYEVNVVWDVTMNGLGCYQDRTTNSTIMSFEGTAKELDGVYHTREDAIRKCAVVAARRHFGVFAMQGGGKCMTDADARRNFKKYGKSTTCVEDGLGGPGANQVFEITSKKRIKLRNLGCWSDENQRAVPGMENTDVELMENYRTREDAIAKCARAANRNGFSTFVLQNGGWCGGSMNAGTSYSLYGSSNGCNKDGKGGSQANQVYEIDEVIES